MFDLSYFPNPAVLDEDVFTNAYTLEIQDIENHFYYLYSQLDRKDMPTFHKRVNSFNKYCEVVKLNPIFIIAHTYTECQENLENIIDFFSYFPIEDILALKYNTQFRNQYTVRPSKDDFCAGYEKGLEAKTLATAVLVSSSETISHALRKLKLFEKIYLTKKENLAIIKKQKEESHEL